ncbi:hypothetical protein TWF481_008505 [Arthrobotrys musiformis]|uniref:Uncharacterized protein n=1 Tax=Arthrobotrys musiformis TaxID=47236 RepID=A0AAV9WD35_9PEZI
MAETTATPSRNNLGPLTTTFTPGTSCSVPVVYCPEGGNCYAWQAQTCLPGKAVDQSFCWPPWTSGASTLTEPGPLNGWGVYSPGFVCPDRHTVACTTTYGGSGNFQFQFAAKEEETVIGCCPDGYFCARTNVEQTCVYTATTSTFDAVNCKDYLREPTLVSIPGLYTNTLNGKTTIVTVSTQTFFAPLFQLVWKEGDRPLTSTSATETETGTAGITGTAIGGSGGGGGGGGGLSTGAKAGIGAGAGVVALVLLGALIWFLKNRSRKRKMEFGTSGDIPLVNPPPPGVVEAYSDNKPAAIAAAAVPVEIAGAPAPVQAVTELASSGQEAPVQAQMWELDSRPVER